MRGTGCHLLADVASALATSKLRITPAANFWLSQ
jgi:hypothetical protein